MAELSTGSGDCLQTSDGSYYCQWEGTAPDRAAAVASARFWENGVRVKNDRKTPNPNDDNLGYIA